MDIFGITREKQSDHSLIHMSITMLVSVRLSKSQFVGADQQPHPVGIYTA